MTKTPEIIVFLSTSFNGFNRTDQLGTTYKQWYQKPLGLLDGENCTSYVHSSSEKKKIADFTHYKSSPQWVTHPNLCTICTSLKSMNYLFAADIMGLSMFAFTQQAPKQCDYMLKCVVQSSKLVLAESYDSSHSVSLPTLAWHVLTPLGIKACIQFPTNGQQ